MHAPKSRPRRAPRRLLMVLGVIGVVALAIFLLLSERDYKNFLQERVRAASGRELVIDGRFGLGLDADGLALVADDVKFANPDWATRDWAFTAEQIRVRQSLRALFTGRLSIGKVTLVAPVLTIEKNADGVTNWRLARAQGGELSAWLAPDAVHIERGRVDYHALGGRVWPIAIDYADLKVSADAARNISGRIKGGIDGVPLEGAFSLGSLDLVWRERATDISASGLIGAHKSEFRIAGGAQNVLRWRGLDLQAEAELDNLSDFSAWPQVSLPAVRDIKLRARLVQPESIGSLRASDLHAHADILGIPSELSGAVKKLTWLSGFDFAFRAHGLAEDRKPNRDVPGILINAGARGDIAMQITGSRRQLDFAVTHARLDAPGVRVRATPGDARWVRGEWEKPFAVTLAADDAADIGAALLLDWPKVGAVAAHADWSPGPGGQHLRDLHVSLSDSQTDITMQGDLRIQSGVFGELRAQGKTAGAAVLLDYMPQTWTWLPLILGEVAFDANAQLEKSLARINTRAKFRTKDLHMSAQGDAEIEVGGGLGDFVFARSRLRAADLQLDGDVYQPATLRWFADEEWPALPQTAYQMRLHKQDDDFRLRDLHLRGKNAALQFDARGEVVALDINAELHADLDVTLRTPDALAPWWPEGWDAPLVRPLFPLKVNAGLVLNENASDLSAVQARHAGSAHALSMSAASFDWQNGAGDVQVTYRGEAWPTLLERMSLALPPPAPALQLDATLRVTDWRAAADGAKLQLTHANAALSLSGEFPSLQPPRVRTAKLQTRLDSATYIGRLQRAGVKDAPFALNLSIDPNAPGSRARAVLNLADNQIIARADWREDANARLQWNARLDADAVDWREMFAKGERKTRLFSNEPLRLDWLQNADGKLSLHFSRMQNYLLDARPFNLRANFNAAELSADMNAGIGQSKLRARLNLNAAAATPELSLSLAGENLDSRRLLPQSKNRFVERGLVDIDLQFAGRGANPAEIAAAANGGLTFHIQDARIKSGNIDLFGADLFFNIINSINPLRERGEYMDMECGVLRFAFNQGVAENRRGIALVTDNVTLLGGGSLAFEDESLRVILRPKARSGLGINTASIAKMVRLGGTLSQPQIETDATGLLQSGVALGAAVVSGGLSLIAQGLFDLSIANSNVCDLALGDNTGAAQKTRNQSDR